jgi:hypothetical protein
VTSALLTTEVPALLLLHLRLLSPCPVSAFDSDLFVQYLKVWIHRGWDINKSIYMSNKEIQTTWQ